MTAIAFVGDSFCSAYSLSEWKARRCTQHQIGTNEPVWTTIVAKTNHYTLYPYGFGGKSWWYSRQRFIEDLERIPKNIFADILQTKQLNFERTVENNIWFGPQDLVSTHVLVYDQTNIYNPQLVLAIRVCYQQRSIKHLLQLPIEQYRDSLPLIGQKNLKEYWADKPNLVDCNAWFVNPDYSFSSTGLKLSELAYLAVVLFIRRRGLNHLCGCTNEKYKASRWAKPIGPHYDIAMFEHPTIPFPHALLLFKEFSQEWVEKNYPIYKPFFDAAFEIVPGKDKVKDEPLLTWEQAAQPFTSEEVKKVA